MFALVHVSLVKNTQRRRSMVITINIVQCSAIVTPAKARDRSGGVFMGNTNAKFGIQVKETKTVDNKKTGETLLRAEASTRGSTGFRIGVGFSLTY